MKYRLSPREIPRAEPKGFPNTYSIPICRDCGAKFISKGVLKTHDEERAALGGQIGLHLQQLLQPTGGQPGPARLPGCSDFIVFI